MSTVSSTTTVIIDTNGCSLTSMEEDSMTRRDQTENGRGILVSIKETGCTLTKRILFSLRGDRGPITAHFQHHRRNRVSYPDLRPS